MLIEMSTPETIIRSGEPFRPLTRAEDHTLGELLARGQHIAMLAFPDVTLTVDDILPPTP